MKGEKRVGIVLGLVFLSAVTLAAPVQQNKALKAFQGWAHSGQTKMGIDLHQRDIAEIQTICDEDNTALFHVMSFQNGGFAVISADDLIEPVIAFSAQGVFPTDPADPLYDILFTDLANRIKVCRDLEAKQENTYRAQNRTSKADPKPANLPMHFKTKNARWNHLVETADYADSTIEMSLSSIDDVRVNVLLTTRWDQSGAENLYVPNSYPCGCVATAMSQLMRYHSHPVIGIGVRTKTIKVDDVSQTGTTRGGDGSGGPYNWSAMPNSPTSSYDQVGALCFDAGVSVGMSYASDGSGTDTNNAASAFTSWFDYDSAKRYYTSGTASDSMILNAINANLDAAYPVLLGITGSGGHAVVCDGYGYDDSTPYHHINMGWGGISNAWYNLPNIASFDQVYKIVYNVFPDGAGAIISGRVIGSDGYPVSDVAVEADNGSQAYTAVTNSKGIYAIVHVPQGNYSVQVSDDNMTSDVTEVTIGNTTIIDWCPNVGGVDLFVTDTIRSADADAYVRGGMYADMNFNALHDDAVWTLTAPRSFDGVDDYATLSNPTAANGSDELSIAVWFKPDTKGDNKGIVSCTYPGSEYFGINLSGYGSGNPVQFRGHNAYVNGPDYSGPVGQWTHAVGVWKSGQVHALYLDGVKVAENPTPNTGTVNATNWYVGSDRLLTGRYFDGEIKDLRIYSRVLSESEIQALALASGLLVQDSDDANDIAESFIQFDLSGITDPVETARLELKINDNPNRGTNRLYLVSDDNWQEDTITYNNRPTNGILLAEITPTQTFESEILTLIGPGENEGNGGFEYYTPGGTGYVGVDASSAMTPAGATEAPRFYLSGYTNVAYPGWTLNYSESLNSGIDYRFVMYPDTTPLPGDVDGDGMDAYVFGNGRTRIKSNPVSYNVSAGDEFKLAFDFRARDNNDTNITFESVSLFFGSNEVTLSNSTQYPSGTNIAQTYHFEYTATADDASANTVSVHIKIADVTSQTILDNVSLTVTPGLSDEEMTAKIDVSAAVIREMQTDGIVTFCLRGNDGRVVYENREGGNGPILVLTEDTQADSTADWQADSSQPDGPWTYGCYPQGGDYTEFTPFTVRTQYYAGPQSWIGGNGEIWDHPEGYPRVGKYASSPYGYGSHTIDTTSKLESVKRWTSTIKGVITIASDLQQIQDSGDGNIARIRKNGVPVWSQDLNASYRSAKTLQLNVYPGDVIDFAVDPVGNHSADWIYWRARITTTPPTPNQAKLLAHYDLDEASDMPTDADGDMYDRKMFAFDYSGSNRHATLKNADTWTVWKSGLIGNAIDLDGSNDYIEAPALLNPANGPFSAVAWVQGGQASQHLISQQDGGGTGRSWIYLDGSGQMSTYLGGSSLTAGIVEASQWHQVGIIWDGQRRHLCLDGQIVASDAADQPNLESSSGRINLGCSKTFASNWSGLIDDAGFWGRALSDKEIWSMYQAGLAGRNLAHAPSFVTETDIVDDEAVNLADFARLAASWVDNACDKYNFNCDGADIFKDGTVNLTDLQTLANDWLQ